MSTSPRHWQVRIYVDPPPSDLQSQLIAVVVFGETLKSLHANVQIWLLAQQPQRFATFDIDTVAAKRRIYFYSDGQLRPLSVERIGRQPPEGGVHQLFDGMALVSESPLDSGWYLDIPMGGGRPTFMGDVNRAIANFLEHMIVSPGPEHINRSLQPEPIALLQVRGLWRVADELQARDLVQQGWKLIVIEQEYQQERNKHRSTYLLAHTDPSALTVLLNHS